MKRCLLFTSIYYCAAGEKESTEAWSGARSQAMEGNEQRCPVRGEEETQKEERRPWGLSPSLPDGHWEPDIAPIDSSL